MRRTTFLLENYPAPHPKLPCSLSKTTRTPPTISEKKNSAGGEQFILVCGKPPPSLSGRRVDWSFLPQFARSCKPVVAAVTSDAWRNRMKCGSGDASHRSLLLGKGKFCWGRALCFGNWGSTPLLFSRNYSQRISLGILAGISLRNIQRKSGWNCPPKLQPKTRRKKPQEIKLESSAAKILH